MSDNQDTEITSGRGHAPLLERLRESNITYHEAFQSAFLVVAGVVLLLTIYPRADGGAAAIILAFAGGFLIVGLYVAIAGWRSDASEGAPGDRT